MQYDKYKHIHTDLHGQLLAKRAIDWKVINEWVWFESRICREWLQGQLGEVLSVKTGEYGTFKGPLA